MAEAAGAEHQRERDAYALAKIMVTLTTGGRRR